MITNELKIVVFIIINVGWVLCWLRVLPFLFKFTFLVCCCWFFDFQCIENVTKLNDKQTNGAKRFQWTWKYNFFVLLFSFFCFTRIVLKGWRERKKKKTMAEPQKTKRKMWIRKKQIYKRNRIENKMTFHKEWWVMQYMYMVMISLWKALGLSHNRWCRCFLYYFLFSICLACCSSSSSSFSSSCQIK